MEHRACVSLAWRGASALALNIASANRDAASIFQGRTPPIAVGKHPVCPTVWSHNLLNKILSGQIFQIIQIEVSPRSPAQPPVATGGGWRRRANVHSSQNPKCVWSYMVAAVAVAARAPFKGAGVICRHAAQRSHCCVFSALKHVRLQLRLAAGGHGLVLVDVVIHWGLRSTEYRVLCTVCSACTGIEHGA